MPSQALLAILPSSTPCAIDARKHSKPIVGGAWSFDPLIAPAADHRSNFLRPIKLRDA